MIMSEKILEVKHLGKAFGSNQVLRDIDFSVSPGDVTCIIDDKQALVLVNRGEASGIEIAHLANEIKKSVFLEFGVWLEPEVNII